MAKNHSSNKLHALTKNERLCNFTLKQLLFNEGEQFGQFPLRIYWKLIDPNLEQIFFNQSVTTIEPQEPATIFKQQNPSFPHKIIPANALFHTPAKCLIGVSGKAHSTAVARNHLKRLLREGYRQNKHDFYSFLQQINSFCILGIIYTGKPQLSYQELETKIIVSLQKIQEKIMNKQQT